MICPRRFAAVAAVSVALGAAAAVLAGPAAAGSYAHLDDTTVTVYPGCTGTAGSEAMIAPLQQGDRLETGVRVSVSFASDNHDPSCALAVTATWHNLDTGASGSERFTVASAADPASGGHYGTAGYNRANFWTGPGTVALTVSTHPDTGMRVTV